MKKVLVFMFLLLSVFSFSKSVVKTQSNNAAAAYKSLSVTRTVFKDASVQKFADDYAKRRRENTPRFSIVRTEPN